MKYYARGNYYGSSTSAGFANTNYVLVFGSRRARDAWVDGADDASAAPIKRSDATRIAANGDAPTPFGRDFWGIAPAFFPDIPGLLGQLIKCSQYDSYPRFYQEDK